MIIYLLRRLLLSLITLMILVVVGFSVSYYTPHAPLASEGVFTAFIHYVSALYEATLAFPPLTVSQLVNS